MSVDTCNICKWFAGEYDSLIIYRGDYFTLFFPKIPMVYREDGGHLILIPNRHVVDIRFFTPSESLEYMKFMQITSAVMYDLVPEMGIPIGRINYHDNGNFEADKVIGAHQHLHIYGRSKKSYKQTWKDNLRFPSWNPDNEYYQAATHFTSVEKIKIKEMVAMLFKKI
jgi:diadenosine tetraphosphate (Ap4A) HIT family hydrolase